MVQPMKVRRQSSLKVKKNTKFKKSSESIMVVSLSVGRAMVLKKTRGLKLATLCMHLM